MPWTEYIFSSIIRYVAFARDAGNIAQGAKNGARVIYGDGCKCL